jgi:vacuolar-type H+-ATPase subunit C/Vma6
MAEIGGKRMVGEIGALLDDVRKSIADAKLGITGAVTELVEEVKDLKNIETAIRGETAAVRDLKTSVLGNGTGGENGT